MRMLAISFLLFLSCASYAQQESSSIIQQFISDGEQYGFGAEYHIRTNLKGVYFLPPRRFKKYLKGATKDKASWIGKSEEGIVMLIDKRYRNKPGILKGIIYHELGHLFGLSHEPLEGVIMSASSTTEWRVTRGEIIRLFSNIKEVPPKYYMK